MTTCAVLHAPRGLRWLARRSQGAWNLPTSIAHTVTAVTVYRPTKRQQIDCNDGLAAFSAIRACELTERLSLAVPDRRESGGLDRTRICDLLRVKQAL